MLRIKRFIVNMLEENCYVASDATGEAAIIDCGAYFDEDRQAISDYIEEQYLHPVCHLLTHGHFDHVFGAQFLCDRYGLHPRVSTLDARTYSMQTEQLQLFLHRSLPISTPAPGECFADGDVLTFGTHRLQVIATPGHTPGGVCFYEESEGVLFSGDSLFLQSIGRCDLPGGNQAALLASLNKRILALPDNVRVLPGHGPETTVGHERKFNPYLA